MKKKIIFLSLISLLLFITPSIKASGYQIDSYDVDIVVNKNNTFDITETIDAYFNTYKHGIMRKIPLKNRLERLDGTITNNKVKISNVSVDSKFSKYKENGYYVIKIGSSSKNLIGKQKYVIKYNYNIGKDPLKDKDEFYFNIIGTEWNTTISNVTFKITMPESFDSSKLGFSSGKCGNVSNNVTYNANGNVITGKYNGTLNDGEAITIRLELPEGYFVGARNVLNLIDFKNYLIPISLFLLTLFIWNKFCKNKKPVETIEFYPPDNLNSLEIGNLYRGEVNDKDVISLLVYLANKGYIKIEDVIELRNNNFLRDYWVVKLKEYDGNNEIEKIFLDSIFKHIQINTLLSVANGQKPVTAKESSKVNSKKLKEDLPNVSTIIKSMLNGKDNKSKIFVSNRLWQFVICLLGFLILDISIIIPSMQISTPDLVKTELIILGVNNVLVLPFSIYLAGPGGQLYVAIVIKFFLSIIFCPFVMMDIIKEPGYLIFFGVGLLLSIVVMCFLGHIDKRTEYGNKMLGRIRGFKNFLETAEKEKLQTMVESNPTYFYDIIPYAYVLGVSDKWIKRFEEFCIPNPSWYDNNSEYKDIGFETFVDNIMPSIEKNVSYKNRINSRSTIFSNSDSSDHWFSGSSSSGGGFSGGGSGGGGGSSW